MQIEQKHLGPYLPYGLEFWSASEFHEMTGLLSNGVYMKSVLPNGTFYNVIGWEELEIDFRAILRPLSDLKKHIVREYYVSQVDDDLTRIIRETLSYPENQSYSYTSFLLSKHFDIFGLIEKGLAIDINTLKQ